MKKKAPQKKIVLLAHNIRSLWNVGSLFRSADCFAVEKLYLTGYTANPPRREISKTAIGADEWIPWESQASPLDIMKNLKNEGWSIVALECAEGASDISTFTAPEKVCLVVGHEITGIPKEILEVSDHVVAIPMFGKKESLNVAVAAGIALSHLRLSCL